MQIKIILTVLLFLGVCQISCSQHSSTTTVRIIDQNQDPIVGAMVRITYPLKRSGQYSTGEGRTNDEGLYSYSGESFAGFSVLVHKEGYYEGRYQGKVYDVKEGERKWIDPNLTITMKKIKNPVPMYAKSEFEIVLPRPNEAFGFDLKVCDLVSPYGDGETSDLLLEVNGYYNGLNDNDSVLIISFPREGDGILAFEGNFRKGSRLISPHAAPTSGYASEWRWRKSRKLSDNPREKSYGNYVIKHDYQAEGINYILRVRTVLDENGEVLRANYAKIYGDISFFGAHEDGCFVKIFSYYFNPRVNDRNLEYKVGENMLGGLPMYKDPKLP